MSDDIFGDSDEFGGIFDSSYVDLSWMNSDMCLKCGSLDIDPARNICLTCKSKRVGTEWVVRLETRKYLEKEVYNNKTLQRIMSELSKVIRKQLPERLRYYFNQEFQTELNRIVSSNRNLLVHIAGKTGSGKSYLAQKIAFMLQETYLEFARNNPNHSKDYTTSTVYVEFTIEASNQQIKDMNAGDILIRDEQSKASGEGSRLENERNENLRKAIRGNNINFIDCQPSIEVSSTINFIIYTIGYNLNSKVTVALVYIPSLNKNMETYLQPVGYILMKIHDKIDFLKDYEERKADYIQQLQESAGMETVSLKEDEIRQDAQILIQYIKDKNWTIETKDQWDLMFAFAKIPTRSTKHPNRVIAYAKLLYDTKPDTPQEVVQNNIRELMDQLRHSDDPFLNFSFNEEKALETYNSGSDTERDLQVYKNNQELNMKHTDQAIKFGVSEARIRQILKKVEGHLNYLMGKAFEIYVMEIYKSRGYEILSDPTQETTAGVPDLIVASNGTIEILSLKVSKSIKKTISPYEDCNPEIEEYLQRKLRGEEDVKLFLEWVNIQTMEHRKEELNEKNLQYITTINLY